MERRFMLLIPNMLKFKCHRLEVMCVCCNYHSYNLACCSDMHGNMTTNVWHGNMTTSAVWHGNMTTSYVWHAWESPVLCGMGI